MGKHRNSAVGRSISYLIIAALIAVVLAALRSAEAHQDSWSAVASMVTGRESHTATLLLDGTVLVPGGVDSQPGGHPANAERYDPVANNWSPAANSPLELLSPRILICEFLNDDDAASADSFRLGPIGFE